MLKTRSFVAKYARNLINRLDGTTNAEHDERDANLAGALITLLDPVIKELDEAIKIHDQSYTGE